MKCNVDKIHILHDFTLKKWKNERIQLMLKWWGNREIRRRMSKIKNSLHVIKTQTIKTLKRRSDE